MYCILLVQQCHLLACRLVLVYHQYHLHPVCIYIHICMCMYMYVYVYVLYVQYCLQLMSVDMHTANADAYSCSLGSR